jgi:hypothetical protein
MVLGLKRERWALKGTTLGKIQFDEELQLITIGLVNKSLDVIVQAVLEHMARLLNTLWMVQDSVGATMQDMQLKNEMTKPWDSIIAFRRRGQIQGLWRQRSVVRLVVTLSISMSVMLLGASLNTVGWPKKRWYPNHQREMSLNENSDQDLTIHTPLMSLERVDWGDDMRAGLALVGGVPQLDEHGVPLMISGAADEIAGAIAASTAFFSLTRLAGMYNRSPPDWLSVWDTPTYMTAMQTQINGPAVQSLSVQSQRITDLFYDQKRYGKPFTRTATGFHGIIRMTAPLLATTCYGPAANGPPDNGFDVRHPEDNSTTFSVLIGPSKGFGFEGAECKLTFSQGLVPVDTWIVDMQSASMALHNIAAPIEPWPLPITTHHTDALIASTLATHFAAIIPMLHGQVPSFGVVPHLAMAARMLKTRRTNFTTDIAALAPVIATLAQQQLSTASWTLRAHNDTLISSAPVHWQLYGSGPRMSWEWLTMSFLVILFIVMAKQVLLLVVYKIDPGSWLEPGGMLRTAHKTPQLLSTVDEVYKSSPPEDRERVAKCADNSVRFVVRNLQDQDQWPEFIECTPVVENLDQKTKKKLGQANYTVDPFQPSIVMTTVPRPGVSPTPSTTSSATPSNSRLSSNSAPVPSTSPNLSNVIISAVPTINTLVTQNPSPATSSTVLVAIPIP